MICGNCNNEIPNDSIYCTKCGNRIKEVEEKDVSVSSVSKSKKKNVFMIVFSVILLIVIVMIIVFLCTRPKLINAHYTNEEIMWNMNMEEVKKLATGLYATNTESELYFIDTDAKNPLFSLGVSLFNPIDVKYIFEKNKLVEIYTYIEDKKLSNNEYYKVKEKLISIYGKPFIEDEEIRLDDSSLISKFSTWTIDEETSIKLMFFPREMLDSEIKIIFSPS